MRISRRVFGTMLGGAFASTACDTIGRGFSDPALHGNAASDGRLASRARASVKTTATGRSALGLASGRDAILQLPPKASTDPLPLLVLLHGAGGGGEGILRRLGSAADEAGVAVLAPDSRDSTWD